MSLKVLTVAGVMLTAACVLAEEEKKGPDQTLADFPLACREVETVAGRAPSLLPYSRELKLIWHDEFDGDKLDDTKWMYRTNFWGQSAYWFATPEDDCVELRDGIAHLKLKRRADGQYVSPQLQTGEIMWDMPHVKNEDTFWPLAPRKPGKFLHAFGYYECRCRLQQKPGWWTAFWMQAEAVGSTLDARHSGMEHDVMESFNVGRVIRSAFHWGGYDYSKKGDHRSFHIPDKWADLLLDTESFHTFGMLWTPEGYWVYIDGHLRGHCAENVSHVPEFILLTTEAKWFRRNGKGVPELEEAWKAGDEFLVDYVRVYDLVH